MIKIPKDLALVMDVLVDKSKTRVPEGGYISRATGSWKGLRIGTLNPEVWNFGTHSRKILDPSMEQQLVWTPLFLVIFSWHRTLPAI
jgi:amidase